MISLNESHINYVIYITMFCDDRIVCIYMVYLTLILIIFFGLLSLTCTESLFNILSHHLCGLFNIMR